MKNLQVNIELRRDLEVGGMFVHKVECNHGAVKTVMSFSRPMSLEQVFRKDIVDYLFSIIPVSLTSSVKVVDGTVFPALSFAWNGVHVVVHAAYAGIQGLTIRVKKAVGSAQQMYLPPEDSEVGLLAVAI